MKLTPTALPDVVIVEPTLHSDERGWFYESFLEPRFRDGLQALGKTGVLACERIRGDLGARQFRRQRERGEATDELSPSQHGIREWRVCATPGWRTRWIQPGRKGGNGRDGA